MIAILDYGMANLRSVQKAFDAVGVRAEIVGDVAGIRRSDQLVLPGVGAFKDAIATLRSSGFVEPILQHISAGRPFLGICLGLQMLFDVSLEDGRHEGLGVFAGDCVRFDVDRELSLKVPHMGWNSLQRGAADSALLRGLPDSPHVYFVHSYHVRPGDPSIIATTTDYGRPFVSSIARGNIVATQFHPEKSQAIGLQILKNFAAM